MSQQSMEETISMLYDMVQDSKALPFGADKCILEREKVLDMLDEIIAQIPGEIKQARTIVDSRNVLISQARSEAEGIVQEAHQKAKELVSHEAIYQEAQRQCAEMYQANQNRMAELRRIGNSYMDDALRRTEEAIAQSLAEVQDTRAKFLTLTQAQEERLNSENP